MKKGITLFCFICYLLVPVFFTVDTGTLAAEQISVTSSGARADVIQIDSMTVFGELEKPTVEFLHDAHTDALTQKGRDCSACHLDDNGKMSLKFKRLKDTTRPEVMNVYHNDCIACHGELKIAGEKTGPVECDACHTGKAEYASSRQPMGFDNSLHSRHSQAQDNKCEKCHHEYDENAKKLFYAKGKEGTCRYCHRPETTDNVISMRLASHAACIDCHLKNPGKNPDIGPVNCSGCHDAAAQAKIKRLDPVPRMERNQPDSIMLESMKKASGVDVSQFNRMNPVPFDHMAHETHNGTCRVCHHESLNPCNECHSLTGAKEGDFVNLDKAMHQTGSEMSCMGCHAAKQNDKSCAGCHAFMGRGTDKAGETCKQCHMAPVAEAGVPLDAEQEKQMAIQMLQSRKPVTGTYSQEDIPEKVVIKNLSKEYEAVEFPHRKIVNALVHNIKDNKLAAYFHPTEGTVCQGCHHNSPVSKKPPYCSSCHGKPFDAENPLKPGIKGAYHLQCMGCHTEMGIEKPAGCTDCHKKK